MKYGFISANEKPNLKATVSCYENLYNVNLLGFSTDIFAPKQLPFTTMHNMPNSVQSFSPIINSIYLH